MAFIPLNLNDAKESKPVPSGRYDLIVASCEETKSQQGKPQFVLSIGIEGHPDAPNVRHYASIPGDGDDADKMKFKILFLKRLLDLFGVKVGADGFDTSEVANQLTGARASAELSLSEPDDRGNVYNNLVVPRLRDEMQPVGRGAPKPPKRAA